MSFRFLQFASLYPEFERQLLAVNPDYSALSYQELYDRLVGMHFSLADVYVRHLRANGYAAEYHCMSLAPLQKAWAREHGTKYSERTWMRDIILAQVHEFRPNVIFLQDTFLFDPRFRRQIRGTVHRPMLLAGWRAAPTSDFSVFSDLDVMFTAGPHFVEEFRRHGANACLLPLGFDESVLDCLPPVAEQNLAFTFVGTTGTPNGPHSRRYMLIEKLLEAGLLDVWGDEPAGSDGLRRVARKSVYQINRALDSIGVSQKRRAALPVIGQGAGWICDPSRPTLSSRFPKRIQPPVFGLDAFRILSQSKMTFNCHIGAAGRYAGNNRLYEATGMKTCLVTDWKEDIDRYFIPDVEVVTYKSAEECEEKVRYLLEHESERLAIAAAGQRRTLVDHTYSKRSKLLIDVIEATLAAKGFPLS